MARTETLSQVCESYALSKYASLQDARLDMLAEIADLREALATVRLVVEANDVAEDAKDFARLVEPLIPALRHHVERGVKATHPA